MLYWEGIATRFGLAGPEVDFMVPVFTDSGSFSKEFLDVLQVIDEKRRTYRRRDREDR
jgi:hypothetical protein